MSISSEITRLSGNVSAALTAIGAKGVTVPSGANSDDLATLIAAIETGGGSSGYTRTVIVPQQTVTVSGNEWTLVTNGADIVEGDEYIVTVNGVEKISTATKNGSINYISFIDWDWSSGGYAFGTEPPYSGVYFRAITDGTYTVKIEKLELTGSGGGGGSSTLITKTITVNGTYSASDDSADGYSQVTVNVPTPAAVTMNVQTEQSTARRNNTALGSVTSLTCEVAGTYDVDWTCARSSTSGTWGSQLYINGTAYGTENTTWNNNVQVNHLEDVVIPANATVAIYGRSRSGYYIYVPQLTIQQTA